MDKRTIRIPVEGSPPDERGALAASAQYFSMYGSIIAQAGLVLGHALEACPTSVTAPSPDDLTTYLRAWIAMQPDGEEHPVPITATAYVARAIAGDTILSTSPDTEEVLAVIERWARGQPLVGISRSWSDLRTLLSRAVGLAAADVDGITHVMGEIRHRMEDKDE